MEDRCAHRAWTGDHWVKNIMQGEWTRAKTRSTPLCPASSIRVAVQVALALGDLWSNVDRGKE